jgi:hypothetical protein
MSRTPSVPKTLGGKLADLLDRIAEGLAQPFRPAPVPVPVPIRRPSDGRRSLAGRQS